MAVKSGDYLIRDQLHLVRGVGNHDISFHARCQTDRDALPRSGDPHPGDYDGAWETAGVDVELLDPVFLDASNGFAAVRAKYLGAFFPASGVAEPGVLFRDFFQIDRDGVEKGVVLVDLGSLP